MGLFNKKGKVIDLTERYHQQQDQLSNMRSEIAEAKSSESSPDSSSESGIFNIFGGVQPITSPSPGSGEAADPEEKKRRLGKRLLDMTNKIEDLNNQVYHLQQRIEVLERKNNSGY